MVAVGVVGANGYAGGELLRLLSRHPGVEIRCIAARSAAGQAVETVWPSLRGILDVPMVAPEPEVLAGCDVVFFATPHGVAQSLAPMLLERDVRVIDLSADFRIRDAAVWAHWYGQPHAAEGLLSEAVYGLPELNRERLRSARLVAVPGCYPTAVSLAVLPLLAAGLIDPADIIADAKSGVSGAGRKAQIATLHAEVAENFRPYGSQGHRHLPEIRQTLSDIVGGDVGLVFQPHLVPMIRGIQATIYLRPLAAEVDAHAVLAEYYRNEPFVDVMPPGSHPQTADVRGTNQCRIAFAAPPGVSRWVMFAAIDNLVKGAAGQAIQCMNLVCGFPETDGLLAVPVFP
jgi:N-acetyl-gamma-glutamyl-phosphate reductase